MSLQPIYSHGGLDVPGWPAISVSRVYGRPISIIGSSAPMSFNLVWAPASAFPSDTLTVTIECNGGIPDVTGKPPDGEWVDCLQEGPLVLGDPALLGSAYSLKWAKKVIPSVPFWRTRLISAVRRGAGEVFSSYICAMRIVTQNGIVVTTASYPTVDNVGVRGM